MQQLQLIHLADLGHQVTLKNIDTISSIDLLVYPLSLSSQPDLNDAVLAELHRRRSGNKEDSTSIEKLPFESFDSGTNLKTLSSVNLLFLLSDFHPDASRVDENGKTWAELAEFEFMSRRETDWVAGTRLAALPTPPTPAIPESSISQSIPPQIPSPRLNSPDNSRLPTPALSDRSVSAAPNSTSISISSSKQTRCNRPTAMEVTEKALKPALKRSRSPSLLSSPPTKIPRFVVFADEPTSSISVPIIIPASILSPLVERGVQLKTEFSIPSNNSSSQASTYASTSKLQERHVSAPPIEYAPRSGRKEDVDRSLLDNLYQVYVTHIPSSESLKQIRYYLKLGSSLVGITAGSPSDFKTKNQFKAVYLLFKTQNEQQRAITKIHDFAYVSGSTRGNTIGMTAVEKTGKDGKWYWPVKDLSITVEELKKPKNHLPFTPSPSPYPASHPTPKTLASSISCSQVPPPLARPNLSHFSAELSAFMRGRTQSAWTRKESVATSMTQVELEEDDEHW